MITILKPQRTDRNLSMPHKVGRDVLLLAIFSALTYVFGMVNFNMPGLEGAISDLREIPLLICVFYVSNPFVVIGVCLISALGTPPEGSYLSSFLMHSISLTISYYFYNYLKKSDKAIVSGVLWFLYVFAYYLLFLFPIKVITNFLVGMNLDKSFLSFYQELIHSSQFEIIASALITSLFLVQHKMRHSLLLHKENLEIIVDERTEELTATIEELKVTQQHLVQSEKMASLGTLTTGVAHEINNPLNFISGGLTILEEVKTEIQWEGADELKKQFDLASDMIDKGLDRATGIVKALMTFSYPGNTQLFDSDLHEIIDNTLLFLKSKMPDDVAIQKDYGLSATVPMYPEKMHQVFMNVLDNAIYAVSHSLLQNKRISISTKQEQHKAVVKMFNSGSPIPESEMNQLFDPFFTTKAPGQGTGLGLSISYTIMSEHRGKIWAENKADGVCFIVELPLGD